MYDADKLEQAIKLLQDVICSSEEDELTKDIYRFLHEYGEVPYGYEQETRSTEGKS